jgi:hypothetical protein
MVMGSDRVSLGHVSEQSFPRIWKSTPYRRFRARLMNGEPPSVCHGCSLYRGRF